MTKSTGIGRGALPVLTDEQVAELRELYKSSEWPGFRKAGAKYGVGKTAVFNFIHRRTDRSMNV